MLPYSLNCGQRQRLAVASILSIELDIIVLDEPTTGQYRGHLNKFLARMKMLNEAGKTIILISHDMGVVAEYTSRTIVMKDGGILMDAGTRETDHSSDAMGKYCQQFNELKWCMENGIGKEEIRIITGMKAHLIDEYLKIIEEYKAALSP